MADVFISYSHNDIKKANEIAEFLESNGIDVFIDTKGSLHKYAAELEQEIDRCKILLLIGSKNAYQSGFVEKEVTYAVNIKKKTFLYKIDDAEFETGFGLLWSGITPYSSKVTDKQELLTIIKKILGLTIGIPDPGPDPIPIPKKHIIPVLSAVIIIGLVMLYCWRNIDQQIDKQQLVYELIKEHPDTIESIISTEQEVDLGLPIYWAGFNVGAKTPQGNGNIYYWGEVSPISSDSIYRNDKQGHDQVDLKVSTVTDAARKEWGENWRIPSKKEFEELLEKCKIITNVVYRNHSGMIFIGINGECLFLPYYAEMALYSTSQTCDFDDNLCWIYDAKLQIVTEGLKNYGYAIRAVKDKR